MQESPSREHHPLPGCILMEPRGPWWWWWVLGGRPAVPRGELGVDGRWAQAAEVDTEAAGAEQDVGDRGARVDVAHPGTTMGAGGG